MTSLLLSLLLSGAPSGPVFQDGDRAVFLGDSITVLHTWTRLVEAGVRLRHPAWQLTFVNAGVGGNTVADALERLDVDVLVHQPTVVFINFGMNDASFPEGSADWAFEKNMATLLDRLEAAKVRRIVWLDTTPYDTSVGSGNAFNRRRVARIAELVEFAKTLSKERGVTLVPVNEAVTRAITAWRAAKKAENLMPDRIHPGPALHGVMAAETLAAIGEVAASPKRQARFAGGVLTLDGSDAGVPWTLDAPVSLEFVNDVPPLPLVLPLTDARLLDSKVLVSLASMPFSATGLPPKQRFVVRAGSFEAGRFTGAQLAAGIDLMASAPARVAPGPERADLSVCDATTGHPWANDLSCTFNVLFGKDQLRISMRHEKTRGLPDAVPGYLERLSTLQREWLDAIEADLAKRILALKDRPHVVTLEVEPARDAGPLR